jgi:excisionase family DNA binding protein
VPFKDAMTVQEASRYLSLDERTLAALADDRQVPAIKVEDRWVFSRKSLQKWQEIRTRRAGQ